MSGLKQPFSSELLLESLHRLPHTRRYWIAFSGGADSTALLHAMSELAPQLDASMQALHVNHGLHPNATDWQRDCEAICTELGIHLHVESFGLPDPAGANLEARARRYRYAVAESVMERGDILLTAHHMHDQAETLLLNLTRGSGIDGLAGMPALRPLGRGWLARPLLAFDPEKLRQYLTALDVDWIEDSSNKDLSFDRNFVRHKLLPAMESRWSGIHTRMARSAGHSREAAGLLHELAGKWLVDSLDTEFILSLRRTDNPGSAVLKIMIREWLKQTGAPPLPGSRLLELLDQIEHQSPDGAACIQWRGWRLHVHRQRIWLEEPEVSWLCPARHWDGLAPVTFGTAAGSLEILGCEVPLPEAVLVCNRQGGERIRFAGTGHHRRVKHLLREKRIPPWMRSAVPLILRGNEVAAIADWHVSDWMEDWLEQHDARLHWRPGHKALAYAADSSAGIPVDPAGSLR